MPVDLFVIGTMFNLDSALGVEIQKDRLVFATIKKGLQEYALKNYNIIENYRELPPAELRDKIQRYVKANGFNREKIILGLPRDQAIVRYVELPLEVEENLDQVVRFQIEKFEPTEEERSYYDYVVVEKDEPNKKIVVQLIMVRKTLLDEFLNLFRELNLYPAAVRLSSVALYQVFSVHEDGYPKKEPAVVLNVNPDDLEMGVLAGPNRFFSEKIPLQREELTFERVLSELEAYWSRLALPHEGLSKIYFTGVYGDQVCQEFRSRCQDCEPLLKRLNFKQKNSAKPNFNELVNSIGLAMSGINKGLPTAFNLIPKEKRLVSERASVIPTLLLAGLLVIIGIAVGTREHFQRQELIKGIDAQLQVLQPQVDEVMAIRKQGEERQMQLAELQDIMKGRQQVLLILKDLTEKIPESAFLQNLNISGDKVNITGYADAASALLRILPNSQYLKSVENRYIVPDPSLRPKEKFNFEAVIK